MPVCRMVTQSVLLPWNLPSRLLPHIGLLVAASYERPVRVRAIRQRPTWMLHAAWPDANKRPTCAWMVEVQSTRGRRPLVGPMLTILLHEGCLSVLGGSPTSNTLTTHP